MSPAKKVNAPLMAVTPVTETAPANGQGSVHQGGPAMVSTRLVSHFDASASTMDGCRHRVDPLKLLDLIERIRTAGASTKPVQIAPAKPSATRKVG